MSQAAILFDFDGVIADSEALANSVLADGLTAFGLPTTLDQAYERYMGRRWHEVLARIEEALGYPPPADLGDKLKVATLARLRSDLSEVPGAGAFIRALGDRPKAIASFSSTDRLALCLDVLGFSAAFDGRVFSADMVARGKPEPDIYLLAARALAVDPRCCTVIEDSASGVIAGKAAGMRVIGLCAGSHVRPCHAERLQAVGADHVAESWEAVARLVS